MSVGVDQKKEVLHRYVYELRYEFGQIYWDRAGRVAKEILSEHDEWDFEAIDINTCRLAHRDKNVNFNFGHKKLDLTQAQNADVASLMSVGDFGKLAERLTSTVAKYLELEFFTRIGFRLWHMYPANDREDASRLARELRLFRLEPSLAETIGAVSDVSHAMIADRQRHMVRLSLAPFEQQVSLAPSVIRAAKTKPYKEATDKQRGPGIDKRQRVLIDKMRAEKIIKSYPQFGLLLDLDAYIEDPPYPDALSVSDFIMNAETDFRTLKPQLLLAATKP
jgi:hypothetical protein